MSRRGCPIEWLAIICSEVAPAVVVAPARARCLVVRCLVVPVEVRRGYCDGVSGRMGRSPIAVISVVHRRFEVPALEVACRWLPCPRLP